MTDRVDSKAIKFTAENSVKASIGLPRNPGVLAMLEVSHSDFEAAALSDFVDFQTSSLKDEDLVLGIGVKVLEPFQTATGSGSMTLDVGTSANTDLYVDALDVLDGSQTAGHYHHEDVASFGDATVGNDIPYRITADQAPRITLTSDAQNLSTTTRGSAVVLFFGMRNEDPFA